MQLLDMTKADCILFTSDYVCFPTFHCLQWPLPWIWQDMLVASTANVIEAIHVVTELWTTWTPVPSVLCRKWLLWFPRLYLVPMTCWRVPFPLVCGDLQLQLQSDVEIAISLLLFYPSYMGMPIDVGDGSTGCPIVHLIGHCMRSTISHGTMAISTNVIHIRGIVALFIELILSGQ